VITKRIAVGKISLAVIFLLGLNIVKAQESKEQTLQPGSTLNFEITLTGPDAERVNQVSLYFGIVSQHQEDQVGFSNGFFGQSRIISPHTFHVEAKIPENIASGDYELNQVTGYADVGNFTINSGFGKFVYHVKNTKTFKTPAVAVKPLPQGQ